ncbi:MAG: hypothetical protein LUQ65_02465 [Candidatus Helarchaeota archaeon]|nr:hypothetical protein [Candidatus Helarchaeota archaeon]
MENDNDLKAIEKKHTSSFFLDGLFEITMGFIWIVFAFAMAFYDIIPTPINSFVGIFGTLIGAVFFLIGKRVIYVPRMGMAKYGKKGKARTKWFLIITIIAVVVLLITVVFTVIFPNPVFFGLLGSLGFGTALLFGIIPFAILSAFGFFLNVNRLYLYGAILGCGLFFSEIFNILGISIIGNVILGICGCFLLVAGVIFLILFIKNYPLPPKGEEYGPR